MAKRNILSYPDPRLHTVAKPVQGIDARIKTLVADMLETMYAANGIGLAATQIDVHERVVVIDVSEDRNEPLVLINPEIVWASDEKVLNEEGCLSVPGIYDGVERSTSVRVQALDAEGELRTVEAEGLLAVCIQHELDHLLGKVFVEYLSPLKRNRIKSKLLKQQREDQRDDRAKGVDRCRAHSAGCLSGRCRAGAGAGRLAPATRPAWRSAATRSRHPAAPGPAHRHLSAGRRRAPAVFARARWASRSPTSTSMPAAAWSRSARNWTSALSTAPSRSTSGARPTCCAPMAGPIEITRVTSFDGNVWSWRYRRSEHTRACSTSTSIPQGVVRRYHTGDDLRLERCRRADRDGVRVVFAGTPEFARVALEAIAAAGFESCWC